MAKLRLTSRHRLICGDSGDSQVVSKLMQGERADVCITSPPYAQQRKYDGAADVSDWDGLMTSIFRHLDEVMCHDGQVLINLGLVHKDGEVVEYWRGWLDWMRSQGWRLFGWYVWDQGAGMPGENHGRLNSSHEFVFHLNQKARKSIEWVECKHAGGKSSGGQRDHNDVVRGKDGRGIIKSHKIADSITRVTRYKANSWDPVQHPAMFPVGLAANYLRSWPGIVFEPFSGSGSTILAAAQEGCRCFAIEISPTYCDVAVGRWEKATGQKPTLVRDGEVVEW
jgi:DNA modification methylase